MRPVSSSQQLSWLRVTWTFVGWLPELQGGSYCSRKCMGFPYDDSFGSDGLLRYRYRGTDPDHQDNRGLRFAMQQRLPLVYFHGVVPGRYVAAWPVFVVGDDQSGLSFQSRVRWVVGLSWNRRTYVLSGPGPPFWPKCSIKGYLLQGTRFALY